MHRNCNVRQHCFRPSRGNHDLSRSVRKRIADVVQVALDLFAFGLDVAHAGLQNRIPIHDAQAAVDQPTVKPIDKHLQYGLDIGTVERKSAVTNRTHGRAA